MLGRLSIAPNALPKVLTVVKTPGLYVKEPSQEAPGNKNFYGGRCCCHAGRH